MPQLNDTMSERTAHRHQVKQVISGGSFNDIYDLQAKLSKVQVKKLKTEFNPQIVLPTPSNQAESSTSNQAESSTSSYKMTPQEALFFEQLSKSSLVVEQANMWKQLDPATKERYKSLNEAYQKSVFSRQ